MQLSWLHAGPAGSRVQQQNTGPGSEILDSYTGAIGLVPSTIEGNKDPGSCLDGASFSLSKWLAIFWAHKKPT